MAAGMLALAVCLVGLLSWYTDESDASAILAVARTARPVHVARDGHRHQMVRTVPTALAEETETKDGLPAHAGLLTALLPLSYFATMRWGLSSASSAPLGPRLSRPAPCSYHSVVRLLQRRALSNLSGVFRL
jgi:hypothetical protein